MSDIEDKVMELLLELLKDQTGNKYEYVKEETTGESEK